LSKLYLSIVQANTIAKALRDRLFAEIGFTPEMAAEKLEELKKIISAPEGET
jgi:formyltetrahydrofolate synthetase